MPGIYVYSTQNNIDNVIRYVSHFRLLLLVSLIFVVQPSFTTQQKAVLACSSHELEMGPITHNSKALLNYIKLQVLKYVIHAPSIK